MSALLRDAIKPNLVQTTGRRARVGSRRTVREHRAWHQLDHRDPAALSYADIVVTEAGFAFELGAEKFFDINCRYGGFAPGCTVLVTTMRALKMHGGVALADVGKPDAAGVERGLANMEKHVENIRKFEQPCVVAINYFAADTHDEIAVVQKHCKALGVDAVVAKPFTDGGNGCTELAELVCDLVAQKARRTSRRSTNGTTGSRRRFAPSPARCTAPKPSITSSRQARQDQLEKLGYDKLPCASRRRSSRCRTTPRCSAGRRTSS